MIKPWRVNLELDSKGGEALVKGVTDAKKVMHAALQTQTKIILCLKELLTRLCQHQLENT